MTIKTGMVLESKKAAGTYTEIVKIFDGECGGKKQKMVETVQFGKEIDDTVICFTLCEIKYIIRRGIAVVVNNWQSRN